MRLFRSKMRLFRRCGLEDDDYIGASPATLQSRRGGAERTTYFEDEGSEAWEEESVVSAMTTTSDLESVYNETASRFRPLTLRERCLLQHSLPDPSSRSVSRILTERKGRFLPTLSATKEEQDDHSDDMMDNPWLDRHQQQPSWQQMVYQGNVSLNPCELVAGDYQRAWHNLGGHFYQGQDLNQHLSSFSLSQEENSVSPTYHDIYMQLPVTRTRK